MIKITIPNNNQAERLYIIDVFFKHFLGIPYSVEYKEIYCWAIDVSSFHLEIEDAFFNVHPAALSYLNSDNIPDTYHEDAFMDCSIVRLWGSGVYTRTSQRFKVGNDIFANSFFFLSQWEESVLKHDKKLKKFDKLPENELFLVRNGLYNRCVVNEYIEFLRKIFTSIGIVTQNHIFTAMYTHDVDRCYLSSERVLCENIQRMLVNNEADKARRILSEYLSYPPNYNPFDSFDVLMDFAESAGTQAHFYFKACSIGENGYTYSVFDDFVQKSIHKIIQRGHCVGFHASENTSLDKRQLSKEYGILLTQCPQMEKGGRTHMLIYDESIFDNLSNIGMRYDSGVGFQFYNGFRTSVCYAYPIFNVHARKMLNILQIPFNVMDSVSIRRRLSPQEFLNQISSILNEVKKYNGIFVSNWHSNLFLAVGREQYIGVYQKMSELIKDINTKL